MNPILRLPMALPLVLPLTLGLSLPARSESYPAEVVTDFMQACVSSAQQAAPNIPLNQAQNYCQCAINRLQSQMTLVEFTDLDQALAEKRSLNENQTRTAVLMNESIKFCGEQQFGPSK